MPRFETDANGNYLIPANRNALRDFIIWCHTIGDYGAHECVKTLFNKGYRGRELDLAWKPSHGR